MAKEINKEEKDGHVDKELVRKYKKHKNYCNRMLKKAILEAQGINITSKSSLNQIWKVISEILRPEMLASNQMKIMVNGTPSEDPKVIAEELVKFFKTDLKKHLEPLRKKYENSMLKFSFQQK